MWGNAAAIAGIAASPPIRNQRTSSGNAASASTAAPRTNACGWRAAARSAVSTARAWSGCNAASVAPHPISATHAAARWGCGGRRGWRRETTTHALKKSSTSCGRKEEMRSTDSHGRGAEAGTGKRQSLNQRPEGKAGLEGRSVGMEQEVGAWSKKWGHGARSGGMEQSVAHAQRGPHSC
eukprot:357996-Chlamydomonas_euryale.AAC.2